MNKIKSSLNNILVILIYILIFFVLAKLMNNIIDEKIISKDDNIIVSLFMNMFIYIFMFISSILLMVNEIKTDFKILCRTSSINILYGSFLAMLCIYFGNFVGNIIATILGGIGDSANQSAVISMLTSKYGILFFFIAFIKFVREDTALNVSNGIACTGNCSANLKSGRITSNNSSNI